MSQVKFMLRHHFYLGKPWYISVLLYLSTEWCEKDTLKAGSRKSWVTFLPKNPPPQISASHFLHVNHVPNVTGQYRLLSSVAHQLNLKAVWIYLHKFSLFLAVQFSYSVMFSSLQPRGLQHSRPPCPSPRVYQNSCSLSWWCPTAFNLSQHQGPFQWVTSLHQVAKVLEFQLQHQSFQWTPRTDLF